MKKKFVHEILIVAVLCLIIACENRMVIEILPDKGKVIKDVSVTITSPSKGQVPNTTATIPESSNYIASVVTWSPLDSFFLGSTKYTAIVSLSVKEGYTFKGVETAKINTHNAVIVSNTGKEITLSLEFDLTPAKAITGITVKEQPDKLEYKYGDTLDLTGLVVELMYDDFTTEDIPFEEFGINFNTDPTVGTILTIDDHNGATIEISYSTFTDETNALIVEKADPVVEWPSGLELVYNKPLSKIKLPGNGASDIDGTFSWVSPDDLGGEEGTQLHSMIFTPDDTDNYNTVSNSVQITVVPISGKFIVTGGGVSYSDDGIHWEVAHPPMYNINPQNTNYIRGYEALAFGNNTFLVSAVNRSDNNRLLYHTAVSNDGVNWIESPERRVGTYWGLGFGDGSFFSLQTDNIGFSQDGFNWIDYPLPVTILGEASAAYGAGRWVIMGVSFNNSIALTSIDRINWTPITLPSPCRVAQMIYAGGRFVVSSGFVSTDGLEWTFSPIVSARGRIVYGNGIYVAGGTSAGGALQTPIIYSYDAITWHQPTHTISGNTIPQAWAVAYGKGKFIGLTDIIVFSDGDGGWDSLNSNNTTRKRGVMFSEDGVNWDDPIPITVNEPLHDGKPTRVIINSGWLQYGGNDVEFE